MDFILIKRLNTEKLIVDSFIDKKIILHSNRDDREYGLLHPINDDGFKLHYDYISNEGSITRTYISKDAMFRMVLENKSDKLWSIDRCDDLLFHKDNLIQLYCHLIHFLES